ncbi:MAG: PilZ domain-containing protein [Nitrospirota bacterium]
MEEKRRHRRIAVEIMDISGRIAFASNVRILNISLGGVLLKADRQLHLDRTYELRLVGRGKTLALPALVVRSELRESVKDNRDNIIPIYSIGMKFMKLSKEKMNAVADFIKDYAIDYEREDLVKTEDMTKLSGLRLYVRFRVDESERASVFLKDPCKVKKISLGGMLVVCEHEVNVEDTLPMEIRLPDGSMVSFLGRIAMCSPVAGTEPPKYEMGIEIIEMPEAEGGLFKSFVQTIGTSL